MTASVEKIRCLQRTDGLRFMGQNQRYLSSPFRALLFFKKKSRFLNLNDVTMTRVIFAIRFL